MLLRFLESFDEKHKLTIYTKTTNNQYVVMFYKLGEDDYIYSNLYTKVIEKKYSNTANQIIYMDFQTL